MKVKELIIELNKQDPEARIIVAADHDGNNFYTVGEVKKIDQRCDGIDTIEEAEEENSWFDNDVELDIWCQYEVEALLEWI